jgi:methyltransferase family protein
MATFPQHIRRPQLIAGLQLEKAGLEISPLYRPTLLKSEHNVFYTDCTSAESSRKKHSNYEHDEIVELDFIWVPGKRLIECAPENFRFSWAIASHVLEHVPDPIGWILEVFQVLEEGASFSLALPDKRFCYDVFRRETDVADLIDSWIRHQTIPSPRQIYDFLSRSVDGSGGEGFRAFDTAERFEDAARTYSDKEALKFAISAWISGSYHDVHCSVFTPESFVSVFSQLNDLGVINVEISTPTLGKEEFYVKLKKVGEPSVAHPGIPHRASVGFSSSTVPQLLLPKRIRQLLASRR